MSIRQITLQRWIEVFLNILFWIASIAILLLTTEVGIVENTVEDVDGVVIQETIEMGIFILPNFIGMMSIIPFFYIVTFYLTPRYYSSKKYLIFSGLLLLGLADLLLIELGVVYLQNTTFHPIMIRFFIFYNLFFIIAAVVYGMIRHQLKMETHQQALEKEKISAELQLMQSQINPHFMFNALNNLLAISERSENTETSSGITKLSDLLRFMIYDTQAEQVLLSKEIEFIENYIALQKLKYSTEDPFEISLITETNDEDPKIAPTLLIPFVENAFKHGLDIQTKSFIHIKLEFKDNLLHFEVKNSKHHLKKTEFEKKYSGIGLENVKKRLNLIYPNQYNLDIKEDEHIFYVLLKINLTI
ncbi:sensor histidine kinase YesM [Aquimarina sp. EL_43]|uniref:sensor histidine kinase n=1 Tax=unclassified Aquimarina TaxID=2627091 RepID=UPI0018C900B1|nr:MULTISPECIES: histidine kinase [unclassified Aquimarina]MBG6129148.1 sensor histidine kinase YesM [Aquimarina sp. EL_35]MBG6150213.1 sensor histidine kinase YesM [Aquimarina sp. EL_32]MBG6167102.1 sensor histidine kinase YesM [Aquimarina sp. EL_43]